MNEAIERQHYSPLRKAIHWGVALLWLSDDGRSWRADTLISPFRKGADMVSGVAAVGRRLIAVGEVWDPQSGLPGAPAVWIGLVP